MNIAGCSFWQGQAKVGDKKRFDVGKKLLREYLDALSNAAAHSFQRASKKSGKGNKSANPAVKELGSKPNKKVEERIA
jgi:hypothetical protein